MTKIGELANKETVCIITDMNQPVGYAVGNTLEVIEAIDILKNKYIPEDIKEIITVLGSNMLVLAGKTNSIEDGKKMILENISNGKAYQKFIELVSNQGGDISFVENTEKFEKAKYIIPIYAQKQGTIVKVDALTVGELSCYLGAGREKKEDEINPRVGFILKHKVGDKVENGDILGYIHSDDEIKAKYVLEQKIFVIE